MRNIGLISFLIIASCTQKALKSEIVDNMKVGDTLTLYAKFADCGEWGGHIEKVYLTIKENNYYVGFYKDSVSCKTDPNDTRKKVSEKSQKLSTSNRNVIVDYINKFIIANKAKPNGISNACDFYLIIIKDRVIDYKDYGMGWNEFKVMRDKIFE